MKEAVSEAPKRPLDVVALAVVRNRRFLLARSRGKTAFYRPGGKREPGESDIAALRREIVEELGCEPDLRHTAFFKEYDAPAFGEGEGTRVGMKLFRGSLTGTPEPQREIDEIGYFTVDEYAAMSDRARASELVLEDLRTMGIVD